MKRQQFDREFKTQAVRACDQGDISIAQTARDLGINVKLLYRWRDEAHKSGTAAFPGAGRSNDEARLSRHQIARVEMERDILQKSREIVDGTTKTTYQFIQQHQQEYPVRVMCRAFGVAPSGYYRWCQMHV